MALSVKVGMFIFKELLFFYGLSLLYQRIVQAFEPQTHRLYINNEQGFIRFMPPSLC